MGVEVVGMQNYLYGLVLLGLLVLSSMSQAIPAEGARELVQSTADQVIARVRQDRDALRSDPTRLHALVDELIIPRFDFERMSRWVLGKYWRQASKEQQGQFIDEFRKLLVRTYATALLEYSDQTIKYLPLHAESGAESVTVKTLVEQSSSSKVPIDYRMYATKDGWRVFDVSIDGVSLVSNYRSSFAVNIGRSGIDGLLANLVKKNQASKASD